MLLKNSRANWKEDISGPTATWSPKTRFSGAGTWPFKENQLAPIHKTTRGTSANDN